MPGASRGARRLSLLIARLSLPGARSVVVTGAGSTRAASRSPSGRAAAARAVKPDARVPRARERGLAPPRRRVPVARRALRAPCPREPLGAHAAGGRRRARTPGGRRRAPGGPIRSRSLLNDPGISEVIVNGPHEVWVERRGRLQRASLRFDDADALRDACVRLAARAGAASTTRSRWSMRASRTARG